jgi:ankyrin repeat protein
MNAAYHRKINVIKLLFSMYANIDIPGESYGPFYSALHAAIVGGQQPCVQELLERGAKGDTQGPHMFSPIYIATSRSDMIILESLLKNGAERGYSRNALQMAAIHNHHSSVRTLVDAGIDTDSNIDRDIGTHPFHAAISNNHEIVV